MLSAYQVQCKELIDNLDKARTECRQTTLDLESERVGRRRLQDRVAELETLTVRWQSPNAKFVCAKDQASVCRMVEGLQWY